MISALGVLLASVWMVLTLLPPGQCDTLSELRDELEMLTERYLSLPVDGETVLLRRSKRY